MTLRQWIEQRISDQTTVEDIISQIPEYRPHLDRFEFSVAAVIKARLQLKIEAC